MGQTGFEEKNDPEDGLEKPPHRDGPCMHEQKLSRESDQHYYRQQPAEILPVEHGTTWA
jgi:hypothetical protein